MASKPAPVTPPAPAEADPWAGLSPEDIEDLRRSFDEVDRDEGVDAATVFAEARARLEAAARAPKR